MDTVKQIEFNVRVDRQVQPVLDGTLTFEAGATQQQTRDCTLYCYEHHGQDFSSRDPGALSRLFEDMLLGRALPLTFATPAIHDVDVLFAMALFLNRDIAIAPRMPGIVAEVEFVHRLGAVALGHVGQDFARLVRLLRSYFPSALTQSDLAIRLPTAIGWIRQYCLDGTTPALGKPFASARVLDRGQDGFVVAETTGDLREAWVTLFSQGHLRGLLVTPEHEGRRRVACARKSAFCRLDLTLAARLLNEVEQAMDEPATWRVDADWLFGPSAGTRILLPHLVGVMVRV